jgi:hypothetical protein
MVSGVNGLTLGGEDAEDQGVRRRSPLIRSRLAGAFAIITLTTAVAASAGDGQEQVKLNAADQAAARATMIMRGDLRPAGAWTGRSITPDHTAPSCPNFHPKQSDLVVTGTAEADWTRPGRAVVSVADVLQSARMVKLDWQRSGTKAAIVCSLTKAGASNVSVTRVDFPRMAPVAGAYRAVYDITGNGVTVHLVTELAAIGHGRSELSVGEFAPASISLRTLHADVVRLSRLMLRRARA